MDDLISRKALLDCMPKDDQLMPLYVRRCICDAPAVDAVEVVRCKDRQRDGIQKSSHIYP